MASPLHIIFAESVQRQREKASSKDVLLDLAQGLAAQWSRATMTTGQDLSTSSQEDLGSTSWEFRKQSQLWDLIGRIASVRDTRPPPQAFKAEDLLERNNYIAPRSLMNAILQNDSTLQTWQMIKTNLETFADTTRFETIPSAAQRAKSTYRHETLSEARRLRNLGKSPHSQTAQSLDLDASVRPSGVRGAGNLIGKDRVLEQRTVQRVFEFLRQGKLEEAEAYCMDHDESWRVASINGGRAWGVEMVPTDSVMEDGQVTSQVTGNMRRDLWKKTCSAIAANSTLSTFERALYATLIGDLDNSLPACATWEDHLWAHINAKIHARLDAKLAQLHGFWQEKYGDEAMLTPGSVAGDPFSQLLDIFRQCESVQSDDPSVQANEWYARMLMAEMIDKGDQVVEEFVDDLDAIHEENEIAWMTLTFFMTHYALYRRAIGRPVDEDCMRILLETYISQLGEVQKAEELVAIYSAELESGDRERVYAKYLDGLAAIQDLRFEEKQAALAKAREQGLDVRKIANLVSSRVGDVIDFTIREILLRCHSYPKFQHGDAVKRTIVINQSVEWLLCVDETFMDAIAACNRYLRYYLVSDHSDLASKFIAALPEDFIQAFQTAEQAQQGATDLAEMDQDQLTELRLYFQLIRVLEEVEKVETIWMQGLDELREAMPSQRMAWSIKHAGEIDAVYDEVLKLVSPSGETDEALVDFVPLSLGDDRSDLRMFGFIRARKMHLGDILFRLHDLLRLSAEHLSKNLPKAIAMCTLLVDPETDVYKVFTQPDHDSVDSEAGMPTRFWLDDFILKTRDAMVEICGRGSMDGVSL